MLFRRHCNFRLGFLMHQLPLVTGLLGYFFGKRNVHSKGLPLVCLIILECVIALAAGPASAELMLPRITVSRISIMLSRALIR